MLQKRKHLKWNLFLPPRNIIWWCTIIDSIWNDILSISPFSLSNIKNHLKFTPLNPILPNLIDKKHELLSPSLSDQMDKINEVNSITNSSLFSHRKHPFFTSLTFFLFNPIDLLLFMPIDIYCTTDLCSVWFGW